MSDISSGCAGEVWGVLENEKSKTYTTFRRTGVSAENPTGNGWEIIGNGIVQLDVFCGEAWGVNKQGKVVQISRKGKS